MESPSSGLLTAVSLLLFYDVLCWSLISSLHRVPKGRLRKSSRLSVFCSYVMLSAVRCCHRFTVSQEVTIGGYFYHYFLLLILYPSVYPPYPRTHQVWILPSASTFPILCICVYMYHSISSSLRYSPYGSQSLCHFVHTHIHVPACTRVSMLYFSIRSVSCVNVVSLRCFSYPHVYS